MIRKIIHIDEELCNGCGLCANACQEGAIGIVDGKAKLLRDDYCDGLGNCLPVCPTNAISFIEREAAAFDEAAVEANMKANSEKANVTANTNINTNSIEGTQGVKKVFTGCPGSMARKILRTSQNPKEDRNHVQVNISSESELRQWPVQIKLVPVNAPYFDGAHLLIAADCTAYAYANFHQEFIRGKITLIGCPKLDEGDYSEKLTEIIRQNNIKSVTIVRMEVPCCGGLARASETALRNSGKFIPWQVKIISTDGQIVDNMEETVKRKSASVIIKSVIF